jgi:hypothetical protein
MYLLACVYDSPEPVYEEEDTCMSYEEEDTCIFLHVSMIVRNLCIGLV